ncbi:hypothetical protein PINS_up005695 [Pythium insidiosum]|nr:hypothetical protein PINS_up005695 [Pythium insidiosum]
MGRYPCRELVTLRRIRVCDDRKCMELALSGLAVGRGPWRMTDCICIVVQRYRTHYLRCGIFESRASASGHTASARPGGSRCSGWTTRPCRSLVTKDPSTCTTSWYVHTCHHRQARVSVANAVDGSLSVQPQSGSYQKLHFHPQIDSPVWDVQFARRGTLPLLVSCCTSGSLRLAPAKKLFRAPQNSIEICRLRGEKTASVELPVKSLTLSFAKQLVSASAETVRPATREFCERDAALHCVRLSSGTSNATSATLLATAGHAGLVIIMPMHHELSDNVESQFLPHNKKIGRPRKSLLDALVAPWSSKPKKGSSKLKGRLPRPPKVKRANGGITLSSFADGQAPIAARKPKKAKKAKAKKAAASPEPPEFPQFEMESASEPEYQDGESSESESDISLVDDNSDDDRVIGSDSDEEAAADSAPAEDAAENRLRLEYQLDLSEEDAIRLAIQMSELEQTAPSSAMERSIEYRRRSH